MTRLLKSALAAALAFAALLAPAEAGLFRHRARATATCQASPGRPSACLAAPQATLSPPAGGFRSVAPGASQGQARAVPTVGYAASASFTPAVASYSAPSGDPLAHVNAIRARWHLPALGWNQNLANWAATNSATCTRAGQGHHVRPPTAAQCVAPSADPATAANMWLNSPAHLSLILNARSAGGLAAAGNYSTLNLE